MKDIVIIPTYNERENIQKLIQDIYAHKPDISILVVDDNSPDGTSHVVQQLRYTYPTLHLLKRKEKTGLGDAYKAGIKEVLKDPSIERIISMDADGSHRPHDLIDMLKQCETYDLVIGSRHIPRGNIVNWSRWRRNLSKYGNAYSRAITQVRINDMTSGFLCMKRTILERINLDAIKARGYGYQIELKYRCIKEGRARCVEVPIIFHDREKGVSKMTPEIIFEGILTPIRIRLKR